MIVVTGALRDYAWGRYDGLAEWTAATDGPQAELWFGAHPSAPSPLADGSGHLGDALGDDALPLLVKLLAAARPLSIQVHPSRALAAAWADGGEGAPPLADEHEKTEMLVALDDFSTLVGFRPAAEAAALLTAVGLPAPAALAAEGRLGEAVGALLRLPEAERDAALDALPGIVAGLPPAEATALHEVLADYPGDGGALVALCLRHHLLRPGDAVYVPAGTVHAYIRGTGVEVMTSSDNVLRLGLTPKQVAVDAALQATDVAADPLVLAAAGGARQDFAVPGAPFAVTRLHARPGEPSAAVAPAAPASVVLAVHGTTAVTAAQGRTVLSPGQAAVLQGGDGAAQVETAGLAFVCRAVEEER